MAQGLGFAVPSTELRYAAHRLLRPCSRASAVASPATRYCAMHALRPARYCHRVRYAMSGTDTGFATRCPVLTQGLLRDVRY
eukprot:2510773-Rhodomonas_salina.3